MLLDPVDYQAERTDFCSLAPLGLALTYWGDIESHDQIEALRLLRPDMVLMAGGVNGGIRRHVEMLAEIIAAMQPAHCVEDKTWAEDRLGPDRVEGADLVVEGRVAHRRAHQRLPHALQPLRGLVDGRAGSLKRALHPSNLFEERDHLVG